MSQLPTPARNFLSQDVEIKGSITFGAELVSHGKIEGDVNSEGSLTIGPTGTMQGDILAGRVSVHGVVNGNITVQDRCELRGNAQLIGDLESPSLVIEEGATFIGRSNVRPRQTGGAIAAPNQQPKR